MPDKEQIIIDGVDVSECEFYNPYYCGMYIDGYGDSEGVCRDYEDCYYKQLARKTQECEELKERLKTQIDLSIRYVPEKVLNRYHKALEEIERISHYGTFKCVDCAGFNCKACTKEQFEIILDIIADLRTDETKCNPDSEQNEPTETMFRR